MSINGVKRIKRYISILLCAVLAFSCIPVDGVTDLNAKADTPSELATGSDAILDEDGALTDGQIEGEEYELASDADAIMPLALTRSAQVSLNLDARKYENYTDAQLASEFHCYTAAWGKVYYNGVPNQVFSEYMERLDPSNTIIVRKSASGGCNVKIRAKEAFPGVSKVTYSDLKELGFEVSFEKDFMIRNTSEGLYFPYIDWESSWPSLESSIIGARTDDDYFYDLGDTYGLDYAENYTENYLMNKQLNLNTFIYFGDDPIQISSITPASGATGVSTSDVIDITFNQGVFCPDSRINEDNIAIKDYETDRTVWSSLGSLPEWYMDFSTDYSRIQLKNVLVNCEPKHKYYLYISDDFISSRSNGDSSFDGILSKDICAFTIAVDDTVAVINFADVDDIKGVDGGDINTAFSPIIVSKGAKYTGKLPVPIKANYYFDGWYVNKDRTIRFDSNKTISEDITLYPMWTPHIGSSGSSSSGASSSVTSSSGNNWEKTGTGWTCIKNGEKITGYQKNINYNGNTNNYYFDESGIMQTGWIEMDDGTCHYFNENSDGHQGIELTKEYITKYVNNYSPSAAFREFSDIDEFLDNVPADAAFAYGLSSYKSVGWATLKTMIAGGNLGENYIQDKEKCKKFLKYAIEDTDDLVFDIELPVEKTIMNYAISTGLSGANLSKDNVKLPYDLLNALFDDAKDHKNSLALLDALDSTTETGSAYDKAVNSLRDDYNNSVQSVLRNYMTSAAKGNVESTLGDLMEEAVKATGKSTTSLGISADMLIKIGTESNYPQNQYMDNIVVSEYVKQQALKNLEQAEAKVKSTSCTDEDISNYIAAFNAAQCITKAQYKSMDLWYEASKESFGSYNFFAGSIDKSLTKINDMSFYNYINPNK